MKFNIHEAPIVAPCRDNPAVMMRRRADGCIYCDGPRVERTGLMPIADLAYRDSVRRMDMIAGVPDTWLDYGCGHNHEASVSECGTGWDPATGEPEPEGHFDLVTLFHVIEHVDDPVALLRHVRERFTPRTIIIETPNACDWLLDVSEPYRRHWCWTDHRLVMTVGGLSKVCNAAGFRAGSGIVSYVQRYPVENALRWLLSGEPGGHKHSKWKGHRRYQAALGTRTDTLWCEWRVKL